MNSWLGSPRSFAQVVAVRLYVRHPFAAVAALAAPAAAQSGSEIAQVEAHLAAAQSMTARFVQTDSRNRQLAGTVQLKRPGRIRFEYGGGANMLLVGNGRTLTFFDYEVGQKSSWGFGQFALSVLLSAKPEGAVPASCRPRTRGSCWSGPATAAGPSSGR